MSRTPDRIAVKYGQTELTYRELAHRTNQIAHFLRPAAGSETIVGVCMDRSIQLVLAVVGVFKAGCVYFPIEPSYPRERCAQMIADARPALVLTQESMRARLPDSLRHVCLDSEWSGIAAFETTPVDVRASADDLAYVVFTSGSTGHPKGAMIEQRGICNRLFTMQDRYPLSATDRVLQKTPISFDVSVWEFLWPLVSGATLVVAEPDGHRDPAYLVDLIRREEITAVHFVPSMLRAFLDTPGVRTCTSLRRVFCGGEVLAAELRAQFFDTLGAELHNLYGPAEAAIDVTSWQCRRDSREDPVPIGKPVANTRIYITDARLNLVPVGTPGEMCIGGVQVGRGYINRPDLTVERFLPDPFSDDPQARIFRTGDLARYEPDGTIQFLGRIDHQVKLNGQRIEPGEIEAALRQCEGVRDAVVTVFRANPGVKKLVGYVVPRQSARLEPDVLREQLRRTLPAFMIPAHIVQLDAFPVTTNGKIDRAALPDPRNSGRPVASRPRDAWETGLARIWAAVLDVKAIGRSDSFFERGGDSIAAVQLVSRIRDMYEIETNVRFVFSFPVLSEQANEIRQAVERDHPPSGARITRRDDLRTAPLSFAQQRLWFLEQYLSGHTAYNCAFACHIRGSLDTAILKKSLHAIVQRHEILRTTYCERDGEPVQVIAPQSPVYFETFELDGTTRAARVTEALQRISVAARMPIDLEAGPPCRFTLLRVDDDYAILGAVFHHIAFDGWSLRVFLRELADSYEAEGAGSTSEVPELALQYADFAVWQHRCRDAGLWGGQLDYWRKKLSGPLPMLDLPLDHPRPAGQSFRGSTVSMQLDPELTASLEELCTTTSVTMTSCVLAIWQTLFLRQTGQDDIIIGIATAGRSRTEIEDLIGFFVNTLALRTDLSGDPTFREVLVQVHEAALEAYANQDLPFDQIVAQLEHERTSNRQPFIQVLFAGQFAVPDEVRCSDVSIAVEEIHNGTSKFDLTISMYVHDQTIRMVLEYNTDIFEESSMRRMLDRCRLLAQNAALCPDWRVSEIPILTPAERDFVLSVQNVTTQDCVRGMRVHDFVLHQTERTPDAIAMRFRGAQVDYAELRARAEHLSALIAEKALSEDAIVGIFIEPSLEMGVAVLATLMAGKAYLPLATDYPSERLTFMLEDAQVAIVLTTRSLSARIPARAADCMCMEDLVGQNFCGHPPRVGSMPLGEEPAYLMYTSGSTGRPKGVVMPHRALANLLHWQRRHSAATVGTKTLQFAPLSFDVSFQELFSTWATGGTVIFVDSETRRDPHALLDTVTGEEIERLFLPFVALQSLVQAGVQTNTFPKSLKEVITAGEQLRITDDLRTFFSNLPGCTLINQYGPTETHVVSAHVLRGAPKDWPIFPPIGKPIHNVGLYVLDSKRQPVPPGFSGELYIGGAALAAGYLNRPDLTATRFLDDPFSSEPGARIYRTGDLARVSPNGEFAFLGRVDGQVKVRGYRVETAEIEVVLSKHEAVKEAVVVAVEGWVDAGSSGGTQLVAYVVPHGQKPRTEVGPRELREYLEGILPPYMVPTSYVWLESLALTPSGKLDRRALPVPDRVAYGAPAVEATPPRNDVERAVATIWCEVLNLEQLSIHDNFFDLGGHSLLSVRVVSRIRDAFQIDVPVRALFEKQTIAEFALTVEEILLKEVESLAARDAAVESTEDRRL